MSSRVRRKFTPEFKAEAVALVVASGGNIAQVAKVLGLHVSSLGNWVRQSQAEAAGPPNAEERFEIRELRRELRRELDRVTSERDRLAKPWPSSRRRPGTACDGVVLVRRRGEGRPRKPVERGRDVPGVRGVPVGVLRLGRPGPVRPGAVGCRPGGRDRGDLHSLGPDLRAPGCTPGWSAKFSRWATTGWPGSWPNTTSWARWDAARCAP